MMDLITEHIDVWTSAQVQKKKGGRGRGKSTNGQAIYGMKKLRELILDLAVRGKLIPQDPADEPATLVLENLTSQKLHLIKEKKIRKAKVAPGNEMPEVNFDKPIGWELPLLSDLLLNSSDDIVDGPFGSKLKASEYTESGVPIIRIQNIDRGAFKSHGLQFLPDSKAEELQRHAFVAGDIVLNKLGEPAGKTCLVPHDLPYGIIVADIIRIRLDETLHDKQYVVNCINSPIVAFQFAQLAKGVTRQRVNLSQVRSLKIPLPPLAEQHRIVAKVDELMALCDRLEQQQTDSNITHQALVENLLTSLTNAADQAAFADTWQRIADHFDTLFTTEQSIDHLKQTILQLAVLGKLVPQDPDDENKKFRSLVRDERKVEGLSVTIKAGKSDYCEEVARSFQLPSQWHIAPLSEVVLAAVDCPHSTPKWTSKGKICVRTSQFRPGFLDLSEPRYVDEETFVKRTERLKPREDDILYSREGGILGIACKVPHKVELCLGQRMMLLRPARVLNPIFFEYVLNSPLITGIAKQLTTGGAAPRVNVSIVKAYPIPIPPLNEQHRIVAKVDELTALCDTLNSHVSEVQTTQVELADAIVQQATAAFN